MGTINQMITNGPEAELFLNLNTLYIRLDQNLLIDDDFNSIEIAYRVVDDNGEIIPGEDRETYIIPRYNLWNTIPGSETPDYNFELNVKNKRYKFEFTFIYEYLDTPDGGNIYHSKITTLNVNNTIPVVDTIATNQFFRGIFLELLYNPEPFTIFYNTTPTTGMFNIGDVLVKNNGLAFTQITSEVNGQPLISLCPNEIFDGVYYLINHPSFSRIIFENFNGTPAPHELDLNLLMNRSIFDIKIIGDFTYIIEHFEEGVVYE